ncbi:MAG: nuclear transport factor 2 family protein [Chitinophagaceae bacterium]|nr:MAG: nuclear transport factor 2 family protein [Chitinophagaceae bacterium]
MPTEHIANQWMLAFNAKDIESLLALYDDNAQHYSPKLKVREPETNGLIKGKTAMRQWWQGAFENMPTLFYKIISLTANEDRVFMEYVRELEGADDLLVAEVLEVSNGKITSSRVYHG